uniref:Uncharacterized protein n=1 Tax=virus sp. ctrcb4 TaxID=2825824 RepID=A0A8S5RPV8_9VIRU|nr:MAG TPA: hypothetical protein [virus sp. ctrcb4]
MEVFDKNQLLEHQMQFMGLTLTLKKSGNTMQKDLG